MHWPSSNNSNKQHDSTASSGVGPNEVYDISSSPTSSVSSSKIELNTYFDNDSGVGGSNPLDMTPTSLHEPSSSTGCFADQPPYLDTNLESQPWYQTRSAYSAPSSPALPRNGENIHRSRGSSPRSIAMRSHPSMDGINNRPWPKKKSQPPPNIANNSDINWKMSTFNPSTSSSHVESPDIRSPNESNNHDNGHTSTHPSSSSSSNDREVRRPPPAPVKNVLSAEDVTHSHHQQQITTPITKPWSAERFQDVRSLSDLLKQLALEKYTTKLEVCCLLYNILLCLMYCFLILRLLRFYFHLILTFLDFF